MKKEIIKSFKRLDIKLLLKKAKHLKGTDAEGWAVGNAIEYIVKFF